MSKEYLFLGNKDNMSKISNERPTKQSTVIRLDQDVLNWLKKSICYKTKINALLRDAMLKDAQKG